ncbi:hypothetical protein FNV43_RR20977 [Rhamnella rubrinervis]|uniref:Uncharacterized protein n=1 Tax=Rhamnella rubrinervis TaxID=2594499 RepID=A0A8K0DWZ2_9ROSA|nr:hypothetical protein FNV43_RR20977 [Rhamnella rubrinervis]
MRNTWAWAFMAFRTSSIALSLVLHDCVPVVALRPQRRWAPRHRHHEECYLVDPAGSHMLVSKIKPCMFGPWDGATGPPLGVHLLSCPFYRDALLALIDRVRASGAVTLKKLECSKQAYALDTLAWDNIIGFRSYSVGLRDQLGARRRSDTVLVSTISDADQGWADVAYRTPAPYEIKVFGFGEYGARLKLKGIVEGHHQEWSLRLNLTQHGNLRVGGAICLVNSVSERDLSLLTSYAEVTLRGQLLRGTMALRPRKFEAITGA